MSDGLGTITIVAIVLLLAGFAVGCGIWSSKLARKRQADLARLAGLLGLEFSPAKTSNIPHRFRFLDGLAQGSNRYAYNVMSGRYEGRRVMLFDYHFTTGSGKSRRDHNISFFILSLERSFPELIIQPEDFWSKFGQAMGFDDIDFEHHKFSRKFCVSSKDKKFAYDFCNARMIEYLLQNNRAAVIEVEKSALALAFEGCLAPLSIPINLQRLIRIRSLMPPYLFTD